VTRRVSACAAFLLATGLAGPTLHAYLKLGADAGGRIVELRWPQMPVQYFVTNRSAPGVSAAALQQSVAAGFATWGGVPRASLSASFAGFVAAEPGADDGVSVIGFRTRSDLDRVLGATTFTVDDVTGDLVEADIFLNSAYSWSVAPGGESGRYDVQSIATHEIGHLLGLSHSALGETTVQSGGRSVQAKGAVMFPIAYPSGNTRDRELMPDDEAGISDLYGTVDGRASLGSIGGRVTLNGTGVFGAHVVAFNPKTGALTGGFTLSSDGRYVIGGLPEGYYVVRAEPLDDADIDSFFDESTAVNISFRPAYASKLVVVTAGGAASVPDIAVPAK